MQLFQIYKKSFNFFFLVFFTFFISCAVNAQDSSDLKVESKNSKIINKPTKSGVKNEKIKSVKKYQKNIKSKKVRNQKKIKKIVRKRIIKKIYVIKEDKPKKLEESLPEIKETSKDIQLDKAKEISGDYLIESELKDNCNQITEGECLRGDKFFQKPYFHYTLITIFNNKIVAEQYFENNKRDKVFLSVNDGEYIIDTKNKNKIFLVVKRGIVDKLVLIEGDLNREIKISSKCQYSDKLQAFHNLYQTNEIIEKNFFYSDEKNFRGLVEVSVFSEKYTPKIFYSNFSLPNKEKRPVQNLNLCKIGSNIQAIEKEFTKTECDRKFKCTMKVLEGYGSDGFMVKDKNFSFYDFYENNKITILNLDQIQGLMDEVSKLSAEDKKSLKSRCFDDKNVDLVSCSISEKCDDYLTVQACEVNYFYDSDKL